MKRTRLSSNHGFTIIELMIALSVLSVLLVMSTVILINIGALYSKGVNSANLQKTSRSVVNDVSSVLQLSGTTPRGCTPTPTTCYSGIRSNPHGVAGNDKIYAYCIDTVRYSYVMNRELGDDTSHDPAVNTPHVLWRDTLKNSNQPCNPLDISVPTVAADSSSVDDGGNSKGYEIAGKKNRLTRFYISPTSSNNGVYLIDVWMAYGDDDLVQTDGVGHVKCQGGSGTQFCASSQISTTVTGRVY